METVQQNGRFTHFSSKFPSNIYSILYGYRGYRNTEKQRYRDTEIKDTEIKESIYTLATFIYKLWYLLLRVHKSLLDLTNSIIKNKQYESTHFTLCTTYITVFIVHIKHYALKK